MRCTLRLQELTFYAIIGILPHEREVPQKVVIDIEIEYEYNQNSFIDYANVAKIVQDHIKMQKFELVEEALTSTATLLHKKFPQILSLSLTFVKPQILPNVRPSITCNLNFS
ncbi:dihydroneopterin aldolase [Nitratiruptor sp. YY09-18]|uniref:dihydroneopterin aldolase n=1 Tax=Nitratiruptor sp. YY09-18 TaxID=2724901 RepID=UPI001915B23A|nr:dihydroneopterin aldolase [Nitratiruptor sp. YY09-18]BCD67568.1 7,8-dihydroneopterin aldolase/epimerase/oxygenase [Nitratiruptor sp. YY09-18]